MHLYNKLKDRKHPLRCHPRESVICEDTDDDLERLEDVKSFTKNNMKSPDSQTLTSKQSIVSSKSTSLLFPSSSFNVTKKDLLSQGQLLNGKVTKSEKSITSSRTEGNLASKKVKRKAPAPPVAVSSPPPPPLPSTEPPIESEEEETIEEEARKIKSSTDLAIILSYSRLKDKLGVGNEEKSREESKDMLFKKYNNMTKEKETDEAKMHPDNNHDDQHHEGGNEKERHPRDSHDENKGFFKTTTVFIDSRKQTTVEDNKRLVIPDNDSRQKELQTVFKESRGRVNEQWVSEKEEEKVSVVPNELSQQQRTCLPNLSSEQGKEKEFSHRQQQESQRPSLSSSSTHQLMEEKVGMNKQDQKEDNPLLLNKKPNVIDRRENEEGREVTEQQVSPDLLQTGNHHLQEVYLQEKKQVVQEVSQSEGMENHDPETASLEEGGNDMRMHHRQAKKQEKEVDEESHESTSLSSSSSPSSSCNTRRSRSFSSSSCPVSIFCQESHNNKSLEQHQDHLKRIENKSICSEGDETQGEDDGDENDSKLLKMSRLSSSEVVGDKGVKIVGNTRKNVRQVNSFPQEIMNDGGRSSTMTTTSTVIRDFAQSALNRSFSDEGEKSTSVVNNPSLVSGSNDIFEAKVATVFLESSSSSSSSVCDEKSPSSTRRKELLPLSATSTHLTDRSSSNLQSSSLQSSSLQSSRLSILDYSPKEERISKYDRSREEKGEQSKQQSNQTSPSMIDFPQFLMKDCKSKHHEYSNHVREENEIHAVNDKSMKVKELRQSLIQDQKESGRVTKEFAQDDDEEGGGDFRFKSLMNQGKNNKLKQENVILYHKKNHDDHEGYNSLKNETQGETDIKRTQEVIRSISISKTTDNRNLGQRKPQVPRNLTIGSGQQTERMAIDPVTSRPSFNGSKSLGKTITDEARGQSSTSFSSSNHSDAGVRRSHDSNEFHPPLPPKPSSSSLAYTRSSLSQSSSPSSSGCSTLASSPDQQKEEQMNSMTTVFNSKKQPENSRKETQFNSFADKKSTHSKLTTTTSLDEGSPRRARPLPNFCIGSYYDTRGSSKDSLLSPTDGPGSLIDNVRKGKKQDIIHSMKKASTLQSSQSFTGVKSYPLPKSFTLGNRPSITNFQVHSTSPPPPSLPWDDEDVKMIDAGNRLSFQENRSKIDQVLRQQSKHNEQQREDKKSVVKKRHVSLLQINSCPPGSLPFLPDSQSPSSSSSPDGGMNNSQKLVVTPSSGSSSLLSRSPSSSSYSVSPPPPVTKTESSPSSGDEGVVLRCQENETKTRGGNLIVVHSTPTADLNCVFNQVQHPLQKNREQEVKVGIIDKNAEKKTSSIIGVNINIRGNNKNTSDNNKSSKSNDSSSPSSLSSFSPDIQNFDHHPHGAESQWKGKEEHVSPPPSSSSSIHGKEIMSLTPMTLHSAVVTSSNQHTSSQLKCTRDQLNLRKGNAPHHLRDNNNGNNALSRERRRQQDPNVAPAPPPPPPPPPPFPSSNTFPGISDSKISGPSTSPGKLNEKKEFPANQDLRSKLLEEIRSFKRRTSSTAF